MLCFLSLMFFVEFVWSHFLFQTITHSQETLLGLRWCYLAGNNPTHYDIVFNRVGIFSDGTKVKSAMPRHPRKRGKKRSVREHIRRLTSKNQIPLPSIILVNVQSLRKRTDELQGDVLHLGEYRDACLLAFTEA